MSTELTTPIKIEIPGIGTIESADLYLKSDADKVIAELKEKHKTEVKELLYLIRDKDKNFNHAFDIEEKELRYNKYKRCLALAKLCDITALFYGNNVPKVLNMDITDSRRKKVFRRLNHYKKWYMRWLKLAKKFKTN